MTMTQTNRTEISHGRFAVIIDHDGDRYHAIPGRRDLNGHFHPSFRTRSRYFKAAEPAARFALAWVAERAADTAQKQGTLCADDIIRSGQALADWQARESQNPHGAR
jgi:hypothetical protein